jgi:hypothetical protein
MELQKRRDQWSATGGGTFTEGSRPSRLIGYLWKDTNQSNKDKYYREQALKIENGSDANFLLLFSIFAFTLDFVRVLALVALTLTVTTALIVASIRSRAATLVLAPAVAAPGLD